MDDGEVGSTGLSAQPEHRPKMNSAVILLIILAGPTFRLMISSGARISCRRWFGGAFPLRLLPLRDHSGNHDCHGGGKTKAAKDAKPLLVRGSESSMEQETQKTDRGQKGPTCTVFRNSDSHSLLSPNACLTGAALDAYRPGKCYDLLLRPLNSVMLRHI